MARRSALALGAAAYLATVPAYGLISQHKNMMSSRRTGFGGSRTSLKVVPVEAMDAANHIASFTSSFDPSVIDVTHWLDAPTSCFLTDVDPTAVIDPRTYCPNCAKVDNGWFGSGQLIGFDPWGTWRGFVQGSIVSLHDFLYNDLGIKQNTYGLAIMLFTFTLRCFALPLTFLQYQATETTKALAPIMEEIKERFPDDQMQNRVIAKLYEDTETNPLAGCLPPLLQIPVFIGLYRSILNLANAKALEEPFFFLPSLEGPTLTESLQLPQGRGIQWLSEGWAGSQAGGDLVPFLGWEDTIAYCSLPIIIALGQSLTMKLTQPPVDPDVPLEGSMKRTQQILKYLPLMIGFFSLQVPAALCLYWFTSNSFTALATVGVKGYFAANPPVIEWDFLDSQPATPKSQFNLEMPQNMDEALADARLNARPPRESRRLTLASALPESAISVEAVLAQTESA